VNPEELARAILGAISEFCATSSQDFAALSEHLPLELPLERPKNREHGDYASSIALQLAKSAGQNPRELATTFAPLIHALPGVAKVEIAGPGFLNITLAQGAQGAIVREVLTQGARYGYGDALAGLTINLEFISANPTGPLHLGHTR